MYRLSNNLNVCFVLSIYNVCVAKHNVLHCKKYFIKGNVHQEHMSLFFILLPIITYNTFVRKCGCEISIHDVYVFSGC